MRPRTPLDGPQVKFEYSSDSSDYLQAARYLAEHNATVQFATETDVMRLFVTSEDLPYTLLIECDLGSEPMIMLMLAADRLKDALENPVADVSVPTLVEEGRVVCQKNSP